MLNYIWAAFILFGIVYSIFAGTVSALTTAALEAAMDAVGLCVKMLGVMAMWMGFMRIAEESGLIRDLSRKLEPVLGKLFPNLPKGGKAMEYISLNVIANVLGLGWAATPPGIKAMEELQKLNPDKTTASREMCMFLIVNLSSLQLVSINIIGYRAQYSSANPQEIIAPGILATIVSTAAGILTAKAFERRALR